MGTVLQQCADVASSGKKMHRGISSFTEVSALIINEADGPRNAPSANKRLETPTRLFRLQKLQVQRQDKKMYAVSVENILLLNAHSGCDWSLLTLRLVPNSLEYEAVTIFSADLLELDQIAAYGPLRIQKVETAQAPDSLTVRTIGVAQSKFAVRIFCASRTAAKGNYATPLHSFPARSRQVQKLSCCALQL